MAQLDTLLPRSHAVAQRGHGVVAPTPALLEAAEAPGERVLARLEARREGLSTAEAEARRAEVGPNAVATEGGRSRLRMLGAALLNPLVVLLVVLATLSFATGDGRAGAVMTLMVTLSVSLRFVQEARADTAERALRAMIRSTATVWRDGERVEVDVTALVPGDVVELAAGDLVPADVRVLVAKDLFLNQASLTGEALPVEKFALPSPPSAGALLERTSVCFLGTSVASGQGTAVVVTTGRGTVLGSLAHEVAAPAAPTAFDRGVARFTWVMLGLMAVLVPAVFLLNGLSRHDWRGAFFFALAVAVGLTPELLPMIVTVCLSKGAVALSKKKVIVKRLDALQNFGAMDVLCTDKTGTLTLDRVVLERHCDVTLEEDPEVLALAYLNAHFQTGLRNVLDRAILAHGHLHQDIAVPSWTKVDELPFDFERRVLSVVVAKPDGRHRLICKGAPEAVFGRCTHVEVRGVVSPLAPGQLAAVQAEYEELSRDGFRTLALAWRDFEPKAAYTRDDERGLVLRGYVAFFDPPKDSAAPALAALAASGVAVKVLTGDGEAVSRKVCHDVGLAVAGALSGAEVEALDDAGLEAVVERTTLFARLSPGDKHRVVQALQRRGHVVGFLGDGINDAPALKAADVSISVDGAVDIARESAELILLERSLLVLHEGIVEGRKVFANILKYVRMGASSSVGNMVSVVVASAALPFVPMAPLQVLTNNLLYDFSQVPIPTDAVDEEQVAKPRPWDMGELLRVIACLGPVSSLFDLTTFALLWWVLGASAPGGEALFQTGWFVESLLTQTLVIHVIRTRRVPFVQSRASLPLTLTSLCVVAVGLWLPVSPLAPALHFTALPALYWPLLAGTLLAYVALAQGVKAALVRRGWL